MFFVLLFHTSMISKRPVPDQQAGYLLRLPGLFFLRSFFWYRIELMLHSSNALLWSFRDEIYRMAPELEQFERQLGT